MFSGYSYQAQLSHRAITCTYTVSFKSDFLLTIVLIV